MMGGGGPGGGSIVLIPVLVMSEVMVMTGGCCGVEVAAFSLFVSVSLVTYVSSSDRVCSGSGIG